MELAVQLEARADDLIRTANNSDGDNAVPAKQAALLTVATQLVQALEKELGASVRRPAVVAVIGSSGLTDRGQELQEGFAPYYFAVRPSSLLPATHLTVP